MSKTTFIIRLPADMPRTRAHMVLFIKDTPFKPKRVETKKAYQRRAKHQKQEKE